MRIVPRAIVKGVTAASVASSVVLASPSRADVITDWNQTAIAAMKAANIAGNPGAATWQWCMLRCPTR